MFPQPSTLNTQYLFRVDIFGHCINNKQCFACSYIIMNVLKSKFPFSFSISIAGPVTDPKVLIEGVLFRARYLGSTQLVCEGQPTKATRMMQAEEAVSRIKVGHMTEREERSVVNREGK